MENDRKLHEKVIDKLLPKMMKTMKESIEEGREKGFFITRDIEAGEIISGEEHGIFMFDTALDERETIGSFHTHPTEFCPIPSAADVVRREAVTCIGGKEEVKCFMPSMELYKNINKRQEMLSKSNDLFDEWNKEKCYDNPDREVCIRTRQEHYDLYKEIKRVDSDIKDLSVYREWELEVD